MAHWECAATRSEAMKREKYYKAGSGHRVKREIIQRAIEDFKPIQ
jgi:hypothetical protein